MTDLICYRYMKIYIDMYWEMKDDFVFDCRIIGF